MFKLYKYGSDLAGVIYIIINPFGRVVYARNELDTSGWVKINHRVRKFTDLINKAGVQYTFIKSMTKDELFLEML